MSTAPNLYLFDSTLREMQARATNGQGLPVEATPLDNVPRMNQVHSMSEARDLAYRLGGRARMSRVPVSLVDQHGNPIYIVGAGVTENAELEDMAIGKLEAVSKRPAIDFDAFRESEGRPTREQVWGKNGDGGLFLEAIEEKMKHHRRHRVTDPGTRSSDKRVRGYVNGASL